MDAVHPEQTDVTLNEIPLSESKAKAWVDSLSITDFGTSTRRVFHGLVDFNRRMLPAVTRIRIAEMLRPKLEVLVENLQRHLSYQSFPLAARTQKIFELNQSLLLEFAGTYQLAALDMLNHDSEKRRVLQVAMFRVIDYLGKYLLSTYSVYIRQRETVWHDIHHMYLMAYERGMDTLKFADGKNSYSIEARYIEINVLALFKPYSLRQEEVARVARYIAQNRHLVTLSKEPVAEELLGNFVHGAILNNDEPAVILPYGDLPHSPTTRVFNMRPMVMQIDRFIDEVAYENSAALVLTNGLSRNLAKRMIYHLTTVRNREYKRFERNDKVSVVMGMSNVIKVLQNTYQKGSADQKREEDLLFDNMLYGSAALYSDDDEDVDAGTVSSVDQECGVSIWTAVNSSVGGYGLHWEGKERSEARVGQLVGLRDMNQHDNPWMAGVVKWMETRPKQGLFCGVELLSTNVSVMKVLKLANRELSYTFPIEGLMLPSIEGVREEPAFILPAYIFCPGDELKVAFNNHHEERVVLGALDECLGAFAYFRYKQLEAGAAAEDEEDFGLLWDSL